MTQGGHNRSAESVRVRAGDAADLGMLSRLQRRSLDAIPSRHASPGLGRGKIRAGPLDRIGIDRTRDPGSTDPVNPVTIYKAEQIHALDGIADGDSHRPRSALGAAAAGTAALGAGARASMAPRTESAPQQRVFRGGSTTTRSAPPSAVAS